MRLYIVGAGGFGREVFAYLRDLEEVGTRLEVVGFLDDNPSALEGRGIDSQVVGRPEDHRDEAGCGYVLAVGDPLQRRALALRCDAVGLEPVRLVHPGAYVARSAVVEPGAVICPFAFVGPDARVEPHAVLNTYASVGHDARVGRCAVLSPYAVVNGNVELGEAVFLGTHATVQPRVRIGRGSKVSAGSVVSRDVLDYSLAAGNPATARVLFRAWD